MRHNKDVYQYRTVLLFTCETIGLNGKLVMTRSEIEIKLIQSKINRLKDLLGSSCEQMTDAIVLFVETIRPIEQGSENNEQSCIVL